MLGFYISIWEFTKIIEWIVLSMHTLSLEDKFSMEQMDSRVLSSAPITL